jgi:hypothetical protein
VADLVRQHAGELARGEAPQQAFGHGNRRVPRLTGGEGVKRRARDDEEPGPGRQFGALRKKREDVGECAAKARIDLPRPVHAHHGLR